MNLRILLGIYVLSFFVTSFTHASNPYMDEFPSECAYADDKEPLPGHIIRLGFVGWTRYGWSFFFPDRRIDGRLQRAPVAFNVGVIGQDPEENLSHIIRARTPEGSFVVAQIFIGEENLEPVVTCVSRPISLARYSSAYYGPDFSWLDRWTFHRWLKVKKYSTWKYKKRWHRDFDDVRKRFKGWNRDDWRKKRDRDRHDNRHRNWRKDSIRDHDKDRWKDRDRDRQDSGHHNWRKATIKDKAKGRWKDRDQAHEDSLKKPMIKTRPVVTRPVHVEHHDKKDDESRKKHLAPKLKRPEDDDKNKRKFDRDFRRRSDDKEDDKD